MGATEEYSKVVDLVAKYCVHYPMLRFTCKRVEDKRTDVSTHAVQRPDISAEDEEESFLKKLNDVRIDVIKRQYG
jgi:DNA mismatch repair protein MLH1